LPFLFSHIIDLGHHVFIFKMVPSLRSPPCAPEPYTTSFFLAGARRSRRCGDRAARHAFFFFFFLFTGPAIPRSFPFPSCRRSLHLFFCSARHIPSLLFAPPRVCGPCVFSSSPLPCVNPFPPFRRHCLSPWSKNNLVQLIPPALTQWPKVFADISLILNNYASGFCAYPILFRGVLLFSTRAKFQYPLVSL